MSIAEMELIADNFFAKKTNAMHLVPVQFIVDQLMNSKQTEQTVTEAAIIEKEVSRYIIIECIIILYHIILICRSNVKLVSVLVHLRFQY